MHSAALVSCRQIDARLGVQREDAPLQ